MPHNPENQVCEVLRTNLRGRTQTHRRKIAAQNKARTRPCKRCQQPVYFQRCGTGFRAMNLDDSVHRCEEE